MVETPSTEAAGTCRNCGAVIYEGAEWCGMCFTPVKPDRPAASEPATEQAEEQRAEPAPAQGAVTVATTEPKTDESPPAKTPTWPCPVCQGDNPIELDACATCGTPFAALMRQETERPKVDPSDAFRRSLLFPGLGHRMVGRELDGFARGALFSMLFLATVMLGISGISAGAVRFLFLFYAAGTIVIYVGTAVEARRLAEGGEPFVSSRALMWTTVAILLFTVVIVSLVIGTSGRR